MRIDSKLNLVVEVETEEGNTIYVHSTPISREVFEKFFLIIGKTFSSLISEGLSFVSGPRVAAMMLKKIATDQGVWDGLNGVEMGLMAEIRRLSNVIMPSERGWQTFPLQDAIDKKMISQSDLDEVEGLICFFICVSAMSRRTELLPILEKMRLWGSQVTSLNCMAFVGSLPTLTEKQISTETEKPSSVVY
jgi:hypothetical protein